MKKSIAVLAIAFGIFLTTDLKANHYPGYVEIFDRVGYTQWGDNLYLTMFGVTTHYNPNRSGSLVQKQSFTVTKSGYVNYTISGTTIYNDGSVACSYGTGSVWVDGGAYIKYEIVDYGWDWRTNCHRVGLKFY